MLRNGRVSGCFLIVMTGLLKNVWVLLLLSLAVQLGLLYVSVSEVRVPAFLVEKFLKKWEESGFYCSAEEVRLRNLTVITAKGISVGATRGNDPFLRVRRCAVKLGSDALVSGNPIPEFFYVDGATFLCPAINSSTGKAERIFSDGTFILRRKNGEIFIDSAEFCVDRAKFIAYGKIPEPSLLAEAEASLNAKKTAKKVKKNSSREKWSVAISQFAGTLFEGFRASDLRSLLGSCEFVAEIQPSGSSLALDVSVFCENFNFRENVFLENASANQKVLLDLKTHRLSFSEPLCVFARSVNFEIGELFSEKTQVCAKSVSAAIPLPENVSVEHFSEDAFLPEYLFLRADRLRLVHLLHGTLDLDGVLFSIKPMETWAFPGTFAFKGNVASGKTTLACAGTFVADAEDSSLDLAYDVSWDKDSLWLLPQLRGFAHREEIASLKFVGQPQLRGTVKFLPGMVFSDAVVELISGDTRCENIHLCGLHAAGTFSPNEIRFPRTTAIGPDFRADADLFFEFAPDGRFRVRTWGSIDPELLDGRLGWFWERIWRDLKKAESEKRPRADIDVYGRWGERWENVFGAIAGEKCYANGMLVDKVSLRVYEDPLLIAAFDMRFARGDDVAFGNLQWHYAMEPEYHFRDFRFLFDGSVLPKDALQIVGEGLPEVLPDLFSEEAATGTVRGFFSGDPEYYPEKMAIQIRGGVPGDFSIFGIKGKNFKGEIIYDNGVVFVGNPFYAEMDDGTVSGKICVRLPKGDAGIDGAEAALDLSLKNIRRDRLAETLTILQNRANLPKTQATKKAVPVISAAGISGGAFARVPVTEPADNSMLDADFKGTITLPDLQTLNAAGTFSLYDEALFQLQVFGGFSRLLSSLKIDLTTFPMDRAEGSYRIADGTLYLPDLRIYGESGEIDIQADVKIPELSVQGEAVFRNLRGTKIPLLGKLVEWGSASTELLPVKLSGSAENPEWTIATKLSRIWDWVNPAGLLKIPGLSGDEENEASDDE